MKSHFEYAEVKWLNKALKDVDNLEADLKKSIIDLYSVPRSLAGFGFRRSLSYLKRSSGVQYENYQFLSGSKIFDWEVPVEWDVLYYSVYHVQSKKYIVRPGDTNLRVSVGSESIDATLSCDELLDICFTDFRSENQIPYVTSYYRNGNIGICITEKEKKWILTNGGTYHVKVRVRKMPGTMDLAIKSFQSQNMENNKILFWTYLCHPEMVNNELTGPVALNFIASLIQKYGRPNNNVDYVFGIGAETIGALAFIKKFIHEQQSSIVAAHILTCLGGKSDFAVLRSREGNSDVDRVIDCAVRNLDLKVTEYSFLEARGSDERQFDYPTVGIPCSSFYAGKFHCYNEYHSSSDNLDFFDMQKFKTSIFVYLHCIFIWSTNATYLCSTIGEPMLSKIGMWGRNNNAGGAAVSTDGIRPTDVLVLCDGKRDLVDISISLNAKYLDVFRLVRRLEEERKIEKKC